ncbi:voltage and ligand gated potassium channel, putative [Perkinsus marinus ATCC 50983]|uniref:Voltage and ligand gated potassium channel, putative n=1 Tax=Perkinsus marinus (strain ATCC 50983 / TXsc) TaxID=423536 RepID=C5L378_PERM5|nr:voltage and ligand gated potassium channel, putative [Perkinsus marinus ATCC 50983]EER08815.1 voltage and ligand gated potassium channel, putative [Perkinsus marinus ATCC 50983]|eukprot:XP_002776999.1 voltage and ligand gated potassium channel, putative [Perkinsus marinus ATCC 50983]
MIPYRLCFDRDATGVLEILENSLDIFFMLDVVLNFFTGVYVGGQLVMTLEGIAPHYLRTWFCVDVVASFPYEWIFKASTLEGVQLLRVVKFARLLRVIRLLRVLKLKRIISKVSHRGSYADIIHIILSG